MSVSISDSVLQQILDEWDHQEKQGGGPAHDDQCDIDTWVHLIDLYTDSIMAACRYRNGSIPALDELEADGNLWMIQQGYVKIAAFAIAALERLGREKQRWNR